MRDYVVYILGSQFTLLYCWQNNLERVWIFHKCPVTYDIPWEQIHLLWNCLTSSHIIFHHSYAPIFVEYFLQLSVFNVLNNSKLMISKTKKSKNQHKATDVVVKLLLPLVCFCCAYSILKHLNLHIFCVNNISSCI